ncbi:MAG: type IV pilus modification protein PilV [Gammaproteobacteria bacterium]|nr:type IV pilus modification protein PilV [Gammaproteobacteria bacterium]
MSVNYINRLKYPRSQLGISLIEVLVAILVVSIGLLGVLGVQVRSFSHSDSAYFRSQAVIYGYEILDRIRANRGAALNGDYDLSLSELSDLTAPSESAAVSIVDRYDWLRNLDNTVPGAKGALDCDGNAVCRVTVEWNDSHADSDDPTKQIVLAARI